MATDRREKQSSKSCKSPTQSQATFIPPYPTPNPMFLNAGSPQHQFMYPPSFPPVYTDFTPPQLQTDIHEMNNRLKSIEEKFSKLLSIEKEVTHLRSEVAKSKSDQSSLNSRLSEVEKFCETFSDVVDDTIQFKRKIQESVSELQQDNKSINTQIQSIKNNNTKLNDLCLHIQTRSMEENLIFFGVEEARQGSGNGRENTEQTIRTFIKETLQNDTTINQDSQINIDDIKFDRVYRLGGPQKPQETGRPRPIVAKFERFLDRETIRKSGIVLNKSQRRYKIHEHFPKEIEDRRKVLYPIARRFAESGEKVAIVRDKLYVNNKQYDPVTKTFKHANDNETYKQGERDKDKNSPSNPDSHLFKHPMNGARPKTNFKPRRTRTNGSEKSIFETPNRYRTLDADSSDGESNKRKASPLETAAKRWDPHGSNTESEMEEENELTFQKRNLNTDDRVLTQSETNPNTLTFIEQQPDLIAQGDDENHQAEPQPQ